MVNGEGVTRREHVHRWAVDTIKELHLLNAEIRYMHCIGCGLTRRRFHRNG